MYLYEPGHSMSYKIACTPNKDSDRSAQLHSLISLHSALWVAKDIKHLQVDNKD